MRNPGTPSDAALRATIAARGGRRSIAIADSRPPARSHSIAIEPQPAPTSHNVSPSSGASAARVAAADLALGQLPVMLEGIVRQPGEKRQRPGRGGSATGDRDRVQIGDATITPPMSLFLDDGFANPAQMRKHNQVARTPAEPGQQLCHRSRRVAIFG